MNAAVGLALFFLFAYSFCMSQSGVLKGKLLVENVEDEKFLPDKILIVITQGARRDTAVVDHDLSFSFENVKTDSFRFKIIPPSKLPFTLIRFSSEGTTKILEVNYAPICKYSDSKN